MQDRAHGIAQQLKAHQQDDDRDDETRDVLEPPVAEYEFSSLKKFIPAGHTQTTLPQNSPKVSVNEIPAEEFKQSAKQNCRLSVTVTALSG